MKESIHVENEPIVLDEKQKQAAQWFETLRDSICIEFEAIERECSTDKTVPATFERKVWQREGGGGGVMSLMKGNVFEKVGVNISTVHGQFSEEFAKDIPGASEDPCFFATGISLVAHMCSPLVPAVHMNTRYITTTKSWFGGGADLTPMYENQEDTRLFHEAFKAACDKFDENCYPKFKKWCDDYFYLKHRGEPRGVGGIFYDYINTDDWQKDFGFTKQVGKTFLRVYPQLVRAHMEESWTPQQREFQLMKRGRYAEFNLLYDRGTKFGLMTGGNTEAILMSLPPEVRWP